jgi:hypothetical protein
MVTASELVRHFGLWQERAARGPVYIYNRGRPRYVLASVDFLDAQAAAQDRPADAARIADLLDALPEIVVLLDANCRVRASSATARAYFAEALQPGAPVERLESVEAAGLLASAARRAVITGLGETIEMPSRSFAGRLLDVQLAPQPDGVLLLVRDRTITEELRGARADAEATEAAIAAIGGLAHATINLRGYLDAPGTDLAALTGLPREALASARFVTLLAIGSRVAAGEAIEAVIMTGAERALHADLLVNRGDPLAITIGLAPLREGARVVALRAVIALKAPF